MQWSRWTYASSSPPSPSSSRASSKLSHEFNEWYQTLGIHSVYEFEPVASYTPSIGGVGSIGSTYGPKSSLRDWVRHQPLSILQLDAADRAVLKIAGEYMATLKTVITMKGRQPE